jgi:hypothetical protein
LGYGVGRFWVEGLRIDRADDLAGLRWNQWVAIAMVVGGGIVLAMMRRNPILEETDPLEDRDELVTNVFDNGGVGEDAAANADRLDSDLGPVTADPDG